MTKVAEILDKAANLVEIGWVQGALLANIDGRRCYCAGGAVRVASGGVDAIYAPALRALANSPEVTKYDGLISKWNDAPGRTAAEVIAALRATAKRVEHEHDR